MLFIYPPNVFTPSFSLLRRDVLQEKKEQLLLLQINSWFQQAVYCCIAAPINTVLGPLLLSSFDIKWEELFVTRHDSIVHGGKAGSKSQCHIWNLSDRLQLLVLCQCAWVLFSDWLSGQTDFLSSPWHKHSHTSTHALSEQEEVKVLCCIQRAPSAGKTLSAPSPTSPQASHFTDFAFPPSSVCLSIRRSVYQLLLLPICSFPPVTPFIPMAASSPEVRPPKQKGMRRGESRKVKLAVAAVAGNLYNV